MNNVLYQICTDSKVHDEVCDKSYNALNHTDKYSIKKKKIEVICRNLFYYVKKMQYYYHK